MAGLSVGTIPPFYREVYDVVCPGSCTKVAKEVWLRCFQSSSVPDSTLEHIWDMCDPAGTNHIGRDGLYKSLAFTALAQQDKAVEEKSLQYLEDSELPSPTMASIAELKSTYLKCFRSTLPTELGYTYEELKAMDSVAVTIIPEKKGTVFKHVEYLIQSKNLSSSVRRRYRDFETFHELLVAKYPYRLVPRMPPKKLAASDAFIQERRRALRRFLLIIVRHPVLARDELVNFFLTAGGPDASSRLREKFRISPDEFAFNEHAKNAEDLVTEETRVKFDHVREQISKMQQILTDLLQVAHNIESRSTAFSLDMKQIAADLSMMGTDSSLADSWTSGSDQSWPYMKRDLHQLTDKFSLLSQTAQEQAVKESKGFTEKVNLFLDLITAYLDLCDRRDKNVQRKHQKAMAKVQTMVSYKERVESSGRHMADKEDSRMIRRDDELIQIEKRNFFSLFCMDLEAQLIHVNLAQLPEIFQHLVVIQIHGHTEYLGRWDELKPIVDTLGKGGMAKGPDHASTSPQRRITATTGSEAVARSPFT